MLSKLIKKINSPTFQVMYLTFIGMGFAWLVDILIARKLGVGQKTDALIIAIMFPKLVDMVVREGIRQSLVPLFVQYRTDETEERYHNFISSIVNLTLALGIILTILFEIGAYGVVIAFAPGLSPETKAEAVFLFRLTVPMIIFAPPTSILSVMLNSHKHFGVVALRNAITPLFLIIAIALTWNQPSFSTSIAITYVIGFCIFFLMVLWDAFRIGHKQNWFIWMSKNDFSKLWEAGSITTITFIIRQILSLINGQLLPSLLLNNGGISIFYFAGRIVSAAQTLIGASIATTSLPSMTEKMLAGKIDEVMKMLRQTMVKSVIYSAVVVLIIVVLNKQIIDGLYGSNSFDAQGLIYTSEVFVLLGYSLVFTSLIPILETGLYAKKAYKQIGVLQIAIPVLSIVFALILSKWQGIIGIATSSLIVSVLYVLGLIYFLYSLDLPIFSRTIKNSADQ